MPELQRGLIRFHQACLPALQPGSYTVRVDQTIHEVREEPFRNRLDLFVAGPRFVLNPGDVYSVYPPVEQLGAFGNTLPQIVFTRRTLPWERTLDGKDQDETAPCPWLALLVLSPSDLPDKRLPQVETRTVGDLLSPSEKDCAGPDIHRSDLAAYESLAASCNTIDLPASLFAAIVPKKADLPYLTHVREVKTDDKETLSYISEGAFAVAIANRFPELNTRNLACLVSLEGFQTYLSGGTTVTEDARVRLAALASWTFTCGGERCFKTTVNTLDDSSPLCRRSAGAPVGNDATDGEATDFVQQAFALGYVPLNHHLRNGERSFSWYRGPLVPICYPKREHYPFLPCADAALRYDVTTGVLDTSYAAAWQLGRSLALQNSHFAQALYRFRNQRRRRMKATLRKSPTPQDLRDQVIRSLTRSGPASQPEPSLESDEGRNGSQFLSELKALASEDRPSIPAEIGEWLGRALLLYGVPFNYLVPDADMLPAESIRFFYLDPAWMKCLLEGACSVGRNSSVDSVLDEYLRDHFLSLAGNEASAVRTSGRTGAEQKATDAGNALHWPITGFLLRSSIVEGWQGLEMRAEGTDRDGYVGPAHPLAPLRIDRLGPDILLCLFNGKVSGVEIEQPPEGLHFGAAVSPTGDRYEKIHLRRLTPPELAGDQLPGTHTVLPMRAGAKRVVAIDALAADMRATLQGAHGLAGAFTSAELALQLIESPGLARFCAKQTG